MTCEGLSQWGSQNLAQQGYNTTQILKSYYGNVELVNNAPVRGIISSYPGTPLKIGSKGPNVVVVQSSINRISQNYPAIPKVPAADGIFGPKTETSVRKFQEIFDLRVDGIVGPATWYELVRLYTAVTSLAELRSEGQKYYSISWDYPEALKEGDRGNDVRHLQYMLSVLSAFIPQIPKIEVDGIFGPATRQAVLASQRYFGLNQTGVVDADTWDLIYDQYAGIENTALNSRSKLLPEAPSSFHRTSSIRQFPGEPLRQGTRDPQGKEAAK